MRNETSAPTGLTRKLAHPRDIRIYKDNEDEIRKLYSRLNKSTGIEMVQIMRDCIDAGLPLIRSRLDSESSRNN